LLILSIAYSRELLEQETLTEKPLLRFCQKLGSVQLNLQNRRSLINTTMEEFPDYVLDELNNRMSSQPNLLKSMKPFDGIVFSTQFVYDGEPCYEGSFLMNESELKYFRFSIPEDAGERDDSIFLYLELANFERVITSFSVAAEDGQLNTGEILQTTLGGAYDIIRSFLGGDFKVKPWTGILKVTNGLMLSAKENLGDLIIDVYSEVEMNESEIERLQEMI
jgi:hypothetical protein